jgi:hypothetical protein
MAAAARSDFAPVPRLEFFVSRFPSARGESTQARLSPFEIFLLPPEDFLSTEYFADVVCCVKLSLFSSFG